MKYLIIPLCFLSFNIGAQVLPNTSSEVLAVPDESLRAYLETPLADTQKENEIVEGFLKSVREEDLKLVSSDANFWRAKFFQIRLKEITLVESIDRLNQPAIFTSDYIEIKKARIHCEFRSWYEGAALRYSSSLKPKFYELDYIRKNRYSKNIVEKDLNHLRGLFDQACAKAYQN